MNDGPFRLPSQDEFEEWLKKYPSTIGLIVGLEMIDPWTERCQIHWLAPSGYLGLDDGSYWATWEKGKIVTEFYADNGIKSTGIPVTTIPQFCTFGELGGGDVCQIENTNCLKLYNIVKLNDTYYDAVNIRTGEMVLISSDQKVEIIKRQA